MIDVHEPLRVSYISLDRVFQTLFRIDYGATGKVQEGTRTSNMSMSLKSKSTGELVNAKIEILY